MSYKRSIFRIDRMRLICSYEIKHIIKLRFYRAFPFITEPFAIVYHIYIFIYDGIRDLLYFIYCFLQIPGDALRGLGESRKPMGIVLVNMCVIRTILLFLIVPRWRDVRGVAVCYPATWALTGLCMMALWLRTYGKNPGKGTSRRPV